MFKTYHWLACLAWLVVACGDDDMNSSGGSAGKPAFEVNSSGSGGAKPALAAGSGGKPMAISGGVGGGVAGGGGTGGSSGAGGTPNRGSSGSASVAIGTGGVHANVAKLECVDGEMNYSSDVFNGAECNQCATTNCCDPWVECRKDKDCACFVDCTFEANSTRASCLSQCGINQAPKAATWAQCVTDSCKNSCGLDMPSAMPKPIGAACKTNQDCSSGNCIDDGNGSSCYGTVAADGACTNHSDCRLGLCVPTTPGATTKTCVEAYDSCANQGIDSCHVSLAILFCQLHKKCTTTKESFDGCVRSECVSLTSEVSTSECTTDLAQLEKDPSCPTQ